MTAYHRTTIKAMGIDYLDTTGQRIQWARKRAGLTQDGLAHVVGVLYVYISQIETGKKQPSRKLLRKIATALSVSVAFLELETDDPTPPNTEATPELPVYFSAEADEIARLVDGLNESQRALVLNIVRVIAAHAEQLRSGTPATGIDGAQLILGKLLRGIGESAPA